MSLSRPKDIKIGRHFIGPNHPCFVIAEIGQNHQGNLEIAKTMIVEAKNCGAHCVKFQKSDLASKYNKLALERLYDSPNSWGRTYGEHKHFLEFSNNEFVELKNFAEKIGILFTASAMDEKSLYFLHSLNVPFIKIGSGDSTNRPLIKKAADLNIPLIISTGMCEMRNVSDIYKIISERHKNFCLLHCISSYPVPRDQINLNVIETYKNKFPDINIGYSGHELGTDISVMAVKMGAKVIERHFTLDKTWKGTDHKCSLTPEEFSRMMCEIEALERGNNSCYLRHEARQTEQVFGDVEKHFQTSEEECFIKLGKSLVTAKYLRAGTVLCEQDICIKVAEPKGIVADRYESVLGKVLTRNLQQDESILDEDGQPCFIYTGTIIHSKSKEQLEIIDDGLILVQHGVISVIEKSQDNLDRYMQSYKIGENNVFKLKYGEFLIPGLIDTHIHAPQYPNIGLGYDMSLLDWLSNYTYPLEMKFVDTEFARRVYRKIVERTLRNGSTTCSYYCTIHLESTKLLCDLVTELGQRAFVGKINMNRNTAADYSESTAQSIQDSETFIKYVVEKCSGLVQPVITPRFALSCDMDLMTKLGSLAGRHKVRIQTHISENISEVDLVAKNYPECTNYADVYFRAGLLTDKTVLAHGVFLTDDELVTLRRTETSVSHCPTSNTNLQSGLCCVRRLLDAGVKVGLGTDCAGGSSVSMLETIRNALAVSIHLNLNGVCQKLSVDEVFFLATLGGAQALNIEEKVGSFECGKEFDALVINMNNTDSIDLLETYTTYQLFQKFIYLADDRNIERVYVQGRNVSDRSCLSYEEKKIIG